MEKRSHRSESLLPPSLESSLNLSSQSLIGISSISFVSSSLDIFDVVGQPASSHSINLDALHTGRLDEDTTVLSEESRILHHMHINHMTLEVDDLNRSGLIRQRAQSHIVNDGSSEALRKSSSDTDFLHKASEVVETAHAGVNHIVWVVLCSSQDETRGTRFREVQVKRLQLVSATALEHGSDGGEHGQVVVIGDGQFQVADSSEEVETEEVVELEERAVDHGVQILDLKGLGVDDFRGFGFDLLVQEEDVGSGQIREGGVFVARKG